MTFVNAPRPSCAYLEGLDDESLLSQVDILLGSVLVTLSQGNRSVVPHDQRKIAGTNRIPGEELVHFAKQKMTVVIAGQLVSNFPAVGRGEGNTSGIRIYVII